MKKITETKIKVVALKTIFAIITFLTAVVLFAFLTDKIIFKGKDNFDHRVFNFLSDKVSPSFIGLMQFFTFFGKPEFMIPAYLLLIAWFAIRKKTVYAWEVFIMGASSTALLFGLKKIFGRPRPEKPLFENLGGYSFPSGHALLTFVFCSVIIYLVWQSKLAVSWKWIFSIFLVLFSMAVGISRIILRVHYPTDVIAGFTMGYIWVLLGLWVQHKYITIQKVRKLSQGTHS